MSMAGGKRPQAYFKYLLSLLFFGSNGVVASRISLNSYEIVFFRTLLGSLFLIAVFLFSKGKIQGFQNKKHLMFLSISGVAMGVSWMLLFEAYTKIGVSMATLVYYCGPVIVMALSPLIFHERLGIGRIAGFGVVLGGMLLINGEALQQNEFSWGLLYGILSAVMYAFMVIFNKKAKSITGLENAMLQLIVSFVTLSVFMVAKQGFPMASLSQNLLPVLFLGIVNTGIGCYLYFSSIENLSAGTIAIFGYLEPLSAVVFAVAFLQERLSVVQILGGIFIIGGAAIGELSSLKGSR